MNILGLKSYWALIFISICFVACGPEEKESKVEELQVQKGLFITSLDTIYVDEEESSLVGFFFYSNSKMHWADAVSSQVFAYDEKGKTVKTFLGAGDGPTNQNGINAVLEFRDEFKILSGFTLSTFDSTFTVISRQQIDWGEKESYDEMLNNPRADMKGLYEVNWMGRKINFPIRTFENSEFLAMPISMSHPGLNGYWTTEYYQEVAFLGLFNSEMKLEKIGGIRSPKYLDYRYVPNFDKAYLETKGDSILASFPIDPKIYVYDLDLKLLGSFGEEGEGLNMNYVTTQTLDEAEDRYASDMQELGYYDHLFYHKESDLIFRTYLPNGSLGKNSRLQIYKDHELVADEIVPTRFRVLGSKDGVFYADGIVDEENEVLAFFKFTLDEE